MEGTPLYLLRLSGWHIFGSLWFKAVADSLNRVNETRQVYDLGAMDFSQMQAIKARCCTVCTYITASSTPPWGDAVGKPAWRRKALRDPLICTFIPRPNKVNELPKVT